MTKDADDTDDDSDGEEQGHDREEDDDGEGIATTRKGTTRPKQNRRRWQREYDDNSM